MSRGNIRIRLCAALVATPLAILSALPVTADAVSADQVDVRLIQSSDIPVAGHRTTILGDMVAGSRGVANRQVSIAITPAGASEPASVITATTDGKGRFTARIKPSSTFRYTVSFAGDDDYAAAESSARQQVAGRIQLRRVEGAVRAGRAVTLRGRGQTSLAGTKVVIRRGVKGAVCGVGRPPSAGVLATTTLGKDGRFHVRVRFDRAGRHPVFAEVVRTSRTVAGWTAYRGVTVR